MKWKKTMKIGGKILHLIINATEKEEMLNVGWSVGRLVGRVTHLFDDPHVAPYWPTWP